MPAKTASSKRQKTPESIIIGRELKAHLAAHNIDRKTFAEKHHIGLSTLNKFVTGLYSPETLAKILERSTFKLKTQYALPKLGAYSRSNWEGYIRPFLMLSYSIGRQFAIEAVQVWIEWNDQLPGLVLSHADDSTKGKAEIGALWIPQERSPLIYVRQVDTIGVNLILSTMVGEPCMRGLLLTVGNEIANAYIPVAIPIVLMRLEPDQRVPRTELGTIEPSHIKYKIYHSELQRVVDHRYARFIAGRKPDQD